MDRVLDSLCGKIHFNDPELSASHADHCGISEERLYIRVNYDISLTILAEFIFKKWNLGTPDIIISMISGVHQSKAWKKAEHRNALQKGIIKLANTSQAWIFTHGLNYGLAKLIGDAVREDQDRRAVRSNWDHISQSAYNHRIVHPRLIGVVPDGLLNNPDQYKLGGDKVEIMQPEESDGPRPKYEMNPHHTVFVLVNNTSYASTALFRGQLERSLQKEASARKEAAIKSQTLRQEEEMYENASAFIELDNINTFVIPMVCILIQGGPPEIDQVLYYLNDNVPVIIIKGTGLMADLIAFAYEEIMERGGIDIEMDHLRPEIENKLLRYFPSDFKENVEERKAYLDKILECVKLSHRNGRRYLTIFDLALGDSDLADLDWYILKSLFACQPQYAIHKPETIRKNLMLTVMWNRPDLARSEIFQRDFSPTVVKIEHDIFEIALLMRGRHELVDMFLQQGFQLCSFVTAVQLKTLFQKAEDREFFVSVVWEALLEKSPAAPIKDKFIESKLNAIVEHLTGMKEFLNVQELGLPSKRGSPGDLAAAERKAINALIVWAVLMNRFELARVFWKYTEQPIPLALFVSSVYNNLAPFCTSSETEKKLLENGIKFGTVAVDVLHHCYQEASNRAFELLGETFTDFENMTPMELAFRFGNKQFIAHPCSQRYLNEVFNGGIRIVKSQGYFQTPECVKILASAALVFPMYWWITFPRLEANVRNAREQQKALLDSSPSNGAVQAPAQSCAYRVPSQATLNNRDSENGPILVDPLLDMYSRVTEATLEPHRSSTVHVTESLENILPGVHEPVAGSISLQKLRKDSEPAKKRTMVDRFLEALSPGRGNLSKTTYREVSIAQKLRCIWAAPITKFWAFQFIYCCYLALLTVATSIPGCGNHNTDIAVWVWTALNLFEYMCRTYFEASRKRISSISGRLFQMTLIITFLLLLLFGRLIPNKTLHLSLYQSRIVLCAGLLFFYYRLVFVFFPISRKLGPTLEKIKVMASVDFLVFLKMITPFVVAGAVAMQAALYPDYPIGWTNFRLTFHRAFFSLFLTPVNDLLAENYAKTCDPHRISSLVSTNASDFCLAGDHYMHDCPVIGASSYLIIIQFTVILKMILVTLLSAMFYNTYTDIDRQADAIWKFQRYQLVSDFSTRPILPAPLSLLSYCYQIAAVVWRKSHRAVKWMRGQQPVKLVPKYPRKADFFKYWKALAREYSYTKEIEAKDSALAKDHLRMTQEIGEELNRQRSNWYRLRERIISMEKCLHDVKTNLQKEPIAAKSYVAPTQTGPSVT